VELLVAGGAAFEAAFPRVLVRGQPSLSRARGRRGLRLGAAPPEAIARVPKLCPNPIDSDTHCRSLVTSPAGGADDIRRSQAPLYKLADGRRGDRAVRTRAASRVPPRRGARSAAPKVPSIEG